MVFGAVDSPCVNVAFGSDTLGPSRGFSRSLYKSLLRHSSQIERVLVMMDVFGRR